MDAIPLTVHALHKVEMEYHGKIGHTIGIIQHIDLMSRIYICRTACRLTTKYVSPTLTGFQGIKRCVEYLYSHPHKPIFYPLNYCDGSNIIRLTLSGNKVEYYTTHHSLEFHQNADHAIIFNRRQPVSVIINNMLGVSICCKVKIQPAITSDSTDGEIRCM